MRRTAVLLVCLLLAGAAVGCSSGKSYDDTVADCVTALKARPEGDKEKPDACTDVKEDDYTALLLSQVIDDMPKEDRDLLDYSDNGTIDGSIG